MLNSKPTFSFLVVVIAVTWCTFSFTDFLVLLMSNQYKLTCLELAHGGGYGYFKSETKIWNIVVGFFRSSSRTIKVRLGAKSQHFNCSRIQEWKICVTPKDNLNSKHISPSCLIYFSWRFFIYWYSICIFTVDLPPRTMLNWQVWKVENRGRGAIPTAWTDVERSNNPLMLSCF